MPPIAESATFSIGPYRVRQEPMFDNPAWAHYLIFRKDQLVGKQFSRPNLADCEWYERLRGVYATQSRWPQTSQLHRGVAAKGYVRRRREALAPA